MALYYKILATVYNRMKLTIDKVIRLLGNQFYYGMYLSDDMTGNGTIKISMLE